MPNLIARLLLWFWPEISEITEPVVTEHRDESTDQPESTERDTSTDCPWAHDQYETSGYPDPDTNINPEERI